MKYYLPFLFFLSSHAVYSQVSVNIEWRNGNSINRGDTIFYNPARKLVWSDFKGNPDNRSIAAAITSSGFGYSCMMRARNRAATLNVSVYCFYDKLESWVKQELASDYALTHEQHHFDITYIATCMFIKKLRTTSFTMENYTNQLDKIYTECYDAMEKMQNDYDGQTKNGRLKDMQALWNEKVDLQLEIIAIN